MPELPSVPKLYPLRAVEITDLTREVELNLNALLLYLQRLRAAIPLRISVNGTALAGVTTVNIVAGSGVTIAGGYDIPTEVLTLTISAP